MSDYEKLKQELEALRDKCKELEDKIKQAEQGDEPKFERVSKNENYFTLMINTSGMIIDSSKEKYDWIDDARFDNNNYFKTDERAQEVVDKINFLLKLERYHDIYCSDYAPDWCNYTERKNVIIYNHKEKRYEVQAYNFIRQTASVYFSSWEIAQKVCDILNKENRQSACDD